MTKLTIFTNIILAIIIPAGISDCGCCASMMILCCALSCQSAICCQSATYCWQSHRFQQGLIH